MLYTMHMHGSIFAHARIPVFYLRTDPIFFSLTRVRVRTDPIFKEVCWLLESRRRYKDDVTHALTWIYCILHGSILGVSVF
jgi:hypothetical protein